MCRLFTEGEKDPGLSIDWESSRAMPHDLLYPGDPLAEHKSEILDWIEAVNCKKVPRDLPFEEVLKDGVILCNMMNKLLPGGVKQINKKSNDLENLATFQQAMKEFGVPEDKIFQTKHLLDGESLKQVVDSISTLARIASSKPDYKGPLMSPKASILFKREEYMQETTRTCQLKTGSGKRTSEVKIHMESQQTIQQ